MTSESLQTYQTDRKHDTKMKESHSNEELVRKGMTPSDVLIAKVREKFKSESVINYWSLHWPKILKQKKITVLCYCF